MNRTKITLLYIGGFSRSGSTILSKILGEIDGFFNVGEPLYIWNSMLSRDGICGCGAQISKCKTWNRFLTRRLGYQGRLTLKRWFNCAIANGIA